MPPMSRFALLRQGRSSPHVDAIVENATRRSMMMMMGWSWGGGCGYCGTYQRTNSSWRHLHASSFSFSSWCLYHSWSIGTMDALDSYDADDCYSTNKDNGANKKIHLPRRDGRFLVLLRPQIQQLQQQRRFFFTTCSNHDKPTLWKHPPSKKKTKEDVTQDRKTDKNNKNNHQSSSSSPSSSPPPSSSSLIQTFSHHPPTSTLTNQQPMNHDDQRQDWAQFTSTATLENQHLLPQDPQAQAALPGTAGAMMMGSLRAGMQDSVLLPGTPLQDMFRPEVHLASAPTDWTGYESPTLLWQELAAWIGVTGKPLSVAEYMRLCLTHPQYGYYTQGKSAAIDDFDQLDDEWDDNEHHNNDQDNQTDTFETKTNKKTYTKDALDPSSVIGGDFITAPEMSQMFGESLGIWMTLTGQQQERQPVVTIPTTTNNPMMTRKRLNWKSGWQYIEAGPGKGTLLVDLLRFWQSLSQGETIGNTVIPTAIHLLERSPQLRQVQKRRLKQAITSSSSSSSNINNNKNNSSGQELQFHLEFWDATLTSNQAATTTTTTTTTTNPQASSSTSNAPPLNHQVIISPAKDVTNTATSPSTSTSSSSCDKKTTIPVYWHENLLSLQVWQHQNNSYLPTFGVCQEFLDALPIYAFEKTKEGWRERMVDVALRQDLQKQEEEEHLGVTNATSDSAVATDNNNNNNTTTTTTTTTTSASSNVDDEKASSLVKEKLRLRIVLSPEVTPATKTLLRLTDEGLLPSEVETGLEAPVGSVVEVNPEAILFVQDLAKIIGQQGGGALVVDYGQEGSRDSIRSFGQHEQLHFLSKPGQVDVTADVDFGALKHAVNHYHNNNKNTNKGAGDLPTDGGKEDKQNQSLARAFGPVGQGTFLMSMGIKDRAVQLAESVRTKFENKAKAITTDSTTKPNERYAELDNECEEQLEEIYQSLVRLCSADGMGERFKVLAIVPTPPQDGNAFFASKPPGF